MPMITRPYRIGLTSWFLRIPKDLVDLLNITRDTNFEIIFEKDEEGFSLIYKVRQKTEEEVQGMIS